MARNNQLNSTKSGGCQGTIKFMSNTRSVKNSQSGASSSSKSPIIKQDSSRAALKMNVRQNKKSQFYHHSPASFSNSRSGARVAKLADPACNEESCNASLIVVTN